MDRDTPAQRAAKDIADAMQRQLEDVTTFLEDVQRSIEEPLEGQCTLPEFDITLTAPQITEEEAAHMSAAEYLRRTSTPESREEARRALDMVEQEKAQLDAMTAADGHIMTSKEMIEQSAKIAQESTAADTIAEAIFIDTDIAPELDPNSPLFDEAKYLEALASIDYNAISDRLREQMDRVRASYAQILRVTDFQSMPETIAGARERIIQAMKTAGSLLENRDIIEDALAGVIDRLMALTPAELEALQEEAQETAEDGKPSTPPALMEAIIEDATADAVKGYLIRQGTATNTFTKIKPTKRNTSIDPVTKTATIKRGNFSVTIPAELVTGLKTSAYRLLDMGVMIVTTEGARSPTVSIELDEYMKKRGLKDKKEARKQVKADLEALYNASISFKEMRGRKELNFLDMRLISEKGIKNGVITFTFGNGFFNLLKGYPIMYYPPALLKINDKRNPYSYALGRKIAEQKNMNALNAGEGDVISVKTLLAVCDGLPTYDEVMETDRAVARRIIEPFERDLNALADSFTWEYCHSKGAPLTEEELTAFNYETFINACILFQWSYYPDQTRRREAKEERLAEAKAAKQKRGRKPNPKPAETGEA